MRVFVAGASGAIGTRLVPQLIARGHEVFGTFKSPASAKRVRALGAEPVREWPPVLAQVLGAKPPRHVPRWLARLFAGEAVVMMGTDSRGASNAKAKRELGWTLRHPSRREGFVAAYASTTATDILVQRG